MNRRRHTVRTRRRPWEVVQVDDATLLDLERTGQLLPAEPEQPANPVEEVTPTAGDAPVTPADEQPRPRRRRTSA